MEPFNTSVLSKVACPMCPLSTAYSICTSNLESLLSYDEADVNPLSVISADVCSEFDLSSHFIGWRLCFHHTHILQQRLDKKASKEKAYEDKFAINNIFQHLEVEQRDSSSPKDEVTPASSSSVPSAEEPSSVPIIIKHVQRTRQYRPRAEKPPKQPVMSQFVSSADDTISFKPVGHLRSCFIEKTGTPRQGAFTPLSRAYMDIISPENPAAAATAVEGLESFSHVWLIFLFHNNQNTAVNPRVMPPRLNGKKTGLYSTRTPHRPNPIGLSLVKLDRVHNNRLYFSGTDLMDGTPILDVKPYHPADSPMFFDMHSASSASASSSSLAPPVSLSACIGPSTRISEWIETAIHKQMRVEFTPQSIDQITELVPRLHFYNSDEGANEVICTICEVLRSDIRSNLMKKRGYEFQHYFCLDNLKITYIALSPAEGAATRASVGAITFPAPSAEDDINENDVARVTSVEFVNNYAKKPSEVNQII